MQRFNGLFILLVCLAITCQLPALSQSTIPAPTVTATITARVTPTITQTPQTNLIGPKDFDVRVHPDGGLFVGDWLSFEVLAPEDFESSSDNSVRVSLPSGEVLGEATFSPFGIGGRNQATLRWIWDTAEVQAGAHDLEISVQPLGVNWTHTVFLQPPLDSSLPEAASQWSLGESDCCLVHYVTGTAAERDLPDLLKTTDEMADSVADRMEVDFSKPVEMTVMSRVIGHGGFASGDIYISYLDRNYAGTEFGLVLHHELVHILDSRLGGDLRPPILAEGLAVYLTGGHFKLEPLIPRAAALLALRHDGSGANWYIPLETLADEFYKSQHEIGYLQAGALVEYLIETYGWDAFSSFYRDIHHVQGGSHSQAIDEALRVHFGIGFDDLEARFLGLLQAQQVTQAWIDDVRLMVIYYDTVRRYQQAMDASAYFLAAWLPDGQTMRQDGIVADLIRHPSSPEHVTLETLLVSADDNLAAGNYDDAEIAIEAINLVLDAMEEKTSYPFSVHPLASRYYAIVNFLLAQDLKPQRIIVENQSIAVDVVNPEQELHQVELVFLE